MAACLIQEDAVVVEGSVGLFASTILSHEVRNSWRIRVLHHPKVSVSHHIFGAIRQRGELMPPDSAEMDCHGREIRHMNSKHRIPIGKSQITALVLASVEWRELYGYNCRHVSMPSNV